MNGLLQLRLEKVPTGSKSTSPTASATVFLTAPSSPHPNDGLLLLPQRVQKQHKYQLMSDKKSRSRSSSDHRVKREKDILRNIKRQNRAFKSSSVAKSLTSFPATPSQTIGRARSWSEASDGDLRLPLSPRFAPPSSPYDQGSETPRKLSRCNSRVSMMSDSSDWLSRSSTFSRSESPDSNNATTTDPFPAMVLDADDDFELGILDLAYVHLHNGNGDEAKEVEEEVSLSPLPSFAFLDNEARQNNSVQKQADEMDEVTELYLTGPLLTRDLDDDLVCSEIGSVHSDLFEEEDGCEGQKVEEIQMPVHIQSLKKAFSPLIFDHHEHEHEHDNGKDSNY